MNISTIFEEIGDKRGWRFRLFNILIPFNRCLVLKIWYIGIRNYWDICHRQIADGEKIKPSGGVIIFALCLSITSLIITQVEWKRDIEKKRTMLFYFASNIPQEHIAVRTHQSRDSPIECWSTETHCKIELTSTMCGKPTCLCQNVQHQCSGKRLIVCFKSSQFIYNIVTKCPHG